MREGNVESQRNWNKKQQRTGQAPEGFTDASAAGNSSTFRGLGVEKCAKAHRGTKYEGTSMKEIEVYMAKFHSDKPLRNPMTVPDWLTPIQVGAAITKERVAEVLDCCGDNISDKNADYCELTALYWIWKNRLCGDSGGRCRYFGLFHYRRWLDVSNAELQKMADHDVDVVLPFPTVHEPDISEHHARYVKETDWAAVMQALQELEPEYYAACERIFSQEYLYNYNILIAKADVLKAYCEWLFPVLERTEALLLPEGGRRGDRYIGYLGENLLTLYFMYHRELNIVCTGRIMLT